MEPNVKSWKGYAYGIEAASDLLNWTRLDHADHRRAAIRWSRLGQPFALSLRSHRTPSQARTVNRKQAWLKSHSCYPPSMPVDRDRSPDRLAGAAVFATTHWSVVLAAGDSASPQAAAALEQLCRTYWYPLYAYVRRRGFSPEEAQDLTQEFFCRLLASDWLARADSDKGRFRTFLLCGLQNFLANEWQKARRRSWAGGRHNSYNFWRPIT